MLKGLASVAGMVTVVLSVSHAGTTAKVATAVRLEGQLTLDGFVAERQWMAAPPIADFTQSYPHEGVPPTETTSVRILYDDDALYIGVICHDSEPRKIVGQLTRRDRVPESDRFTIEIDSYHDHQTGFLFSANVSGVQTDGTLSQAGVVYDDSWDAVWSVKTRRTAKVGRPSSKFHSMLSGSPSFRAACMNGASTSGVTSAVRKRRMSGW